MKIKEIIKQELTFIERLEVNFYSVLIRMRMKFAKIIWNMGMRNRRVKSWMNLASIHPISQEDIKNDFYVKRACKRAQEVFGESK